MPVLLYIRFPCVNLFLCHLIYSVGLFVSELTPQNSTINLFLKLLLPWLIPVNVLQNPLQCCKVISLQLIKINEKKNKTSTYLLCFWLLWVISYFRFFQPRDQTQGSHTEGRHFTIWATSEVMSLLLPVGFLWLRRVGATLSLWCTGFSLQWLLLLRSTGYRAQGLQ